MKEILYLSLGFCGVAAMGTGMYVIVAKIWNHAEALTGVELICLGFAFLLAAQIPFGKSKKGV